MLKNFTLLAAFVVVSPQLAAQSIEDQITELQGAIDGLEPTLPGLLQDQIDTAADEYQAELTWNASVDAVVEASMALQAAQDAETQCNAAQADLYSANQDLGTYGPLQAGLDQDVAAAQAFADAAYVYWNNEGQPTTGGYGSTYQNYINALTALQEAEDDADLNQQIIDNANALKTASQAIIANIHANGGHDVIAATAVFDAAVLAEEAAFDAYMEAVLAAENAMQAYIDAQLQIVDWELQIIDLEAQL